MIDVRVISIGTLSANPEWGESGDVRTSHATCTLIRSGDSAIIVDPSLPEPIMRAKLAERSGLDADAITGVFLTSFKPDVCRGITAFEHAQWFVSERERESIGVPLIAKLQEAVEEGDDELAGALEADVAILQRCQAAPDRLAVGVDLFPLPGVTPGLAGLLIAGANHTTLICGDAVPTVEHLQQGKVLSVCADLDQARESYAEAVEIADVLVLGRDNWALNPVKTPMSMMRETSGEE